MTQMDSTLAQMDKNASLKRSGIMGILLLALTALLAFVIANSQGWLVDRDFFTYWGGGRGLLNGANLYAPADWSEIHRLYGSTWLENPVFIYAPPTAVFFALPAALPIQFASVFWLWGSELFIVVSLLLLVYKIPQSRLFHYLPWWVLGVALSLPVILTLLMGQASALILVLVVLTSALWGRGYWFSGGLVLGLTMVKPQPVLLLVPTLGYWLWLNRRWRGLVGLGVSLALAVVVTFGLYPNYLSDWSAVATSKVTDAAARMPTLWGITYSLLGNGREQTAAAALLVLLAVVLNFTVVTRIKGRTPMHVFAAAVIFSLLVSPYLWNYDQILFLLPLFVALILLDQHNANTHAVAFLPLGLAALELILLLVASVRVQDTLSVTLPVLIGLVLWYGFRKSSGAGVKFVPAAREE